MSGLLGDAPVEQQGEAPAATNEQNGVQGIGQGTQAATHSDSLELICGPLLNYKHMSGANTASPVWHGSVLIVTKPSQTQPSLKLDYSGPVGSTSTSIESSAPSSRTFNAEKLYEDPKGAFWRFCIDAPIQATEARWEYAITTIQGPKVTGELTAQFYIPAANQSMRIMFHSCNGFSVGTDVDAWSGPALWNDVMRMHEQKPFHVMIGGGDQIYNDGVRVDGPLRPWTDIGNPRKRREFPFDEKLRTQCDRYYYDNYIRWYGTDPFAAGNSQIPQINIWDDHDIIDGFGSYTDHFMQCPVFRGIGGVAHKYYLLFQHHIAPPKSTYTTDAPKTEHVEGKDGTPADAVQMKDTFIMTETQEDESYIIGKKTGPYVQERSRSIYCQLGARIAFVGIDARIERTRHQINYPETYSMIFDRVSRELSANRNIKHIVLLLGVPIAYPRLQWLENILSSPLIGPIRLLNKRFGFAGGFFNQFDGNADLLDDLDDHYTARQHKRERRELIHSLQKIAKEHSVRVTILGGDVHLAAIGRFFSNPKLGIPAEQDWRYMPNVISSAITNKPPPQAVANLLAKRNKIHRLDHDTDETLLEIFDNNPGMGPEGPVQNGTLDGIKVEKKTIDSNKATMPSRNYAVICESHDSSTVAQTNGNGVTTNGATNGTSGNTNGHNNGHINGDSTVSQTPDKHTNPRRPMHVGEQGAGQAHPAATGLKTTGLCGQYGLDITLRVEITPHDKQGRTDGYGFSIPALDTTAYSQQGQKW